MKRACKVHDQVNLLLLPLVGALTLSGMFGSVDPTTVTLVFTCYIVADFVWVAVQPDAVPSLPQVILVHHAVTFVLLLFPLRYPHLARWTCWDGIVELNTFFLIARRQWRSLRTVSSWLYWGTFIPMRLLLYPWLLLVFYREMLPHPWYERGTVVGCQLVLCGFNVVLLALSLLNRRKRGDSSAGGKKGSLAAGGAPVAAAGEVSDLKCRGGGAQRVAVTARF